MTKLRLLLTPTCNRACVGCCNNDWDLNAIPINGDYYGYDEIMLTGGEPMLDPKIVVEVCHAIRKQNQLAKIFIYTAKSKRALDLVAMLHYLDGITLTLHEGYDVPAFIKLNSYISKIPNIQEKSLRLNVFDHVSLNGVNTDPWVVKDQMVWIENCPLPVDEVFKRLYV